MIVLQLVMYSDEQVIRTSAQESIDKVTTALFDLYEQLPKELRIESVMAVQFVLDAAVEITTVELHLEPRTTPVVLIAHLGNGGTKVRRHDAQPAGGQDQLPACFIDLHINLQAALTDPPVAVGPSLRMWRKNGQGLLQPRTKFGELRIAHVRLPFARQSPCRPRPGEQWP